MSAGITGAMVARKMGLPMWMGVAAAQMHLVEDKASDGMRSVKFTKGFSLKTLFDEMTK